MSDQELLHALLPVCIVSSVVLGSFVGSRSNSLVMSVLAGWGACIGFGTLGGCLLAIVVDARAASMPGGNPWLRSAGPSLLGCLLGAGFVAAISSVTGMISGLVAAVWVWRRSRNAAVKESSDLDIPRGLAICVGIVVVLHALLVLSNFARSGAFLERLPLLLSGLLVSAAVVVGGLAVALQRRWGMLLGATASYIYIGLFAARMIIAATGMGQHVAGGFRWLGLLAPGFIIVVHWRSLARSNDKRGEGKRLWSASTTDQVQKNQEHRNAGSHEHR